MKKQFISPIFIVAIGLLMFSCSTHSDSKTVKITNKLNQMDWLIAKWVSTSRPEIFFTTWTKTNDSLISGLSFKTLYEDTLLRTISKLKLTNHQLWYTTIVDNGDVKIEIPYRLTGIYDNKFVFENINTYFPQQIVYIRTTDNSLSIKMEGVENGEAKQEYLYMKKIHQ